MSVNRKRVKRLIEALRSGNYLQTKHNLHTSHDKSGRPYMCCLGVACEISGLGRWKQVERGDCYKYVISSAWGEGETLLMPREVADWYGFSTTCPRVVDDHGRERWATVMNDHDVSFSEIADAFERTFLGELNGG